ARAHTWQAGARGSGRLHLGAGQPGSLHQTHQGKRLAGGLLPGMARADRGRDSPECRAVTDPDLPGAASDRSFARVAAIAAIASAPLAAGNLVAMLAAVHFDLRGMTDPLVLLHAGRAAAPLWRWSMVLDVFGYYLPIVPLVLLLRTSLRYRSR